METGKLRELNVKPGYVVECVDQWYSSSNPYEIGKHYTVDNNLEVKGPRRNGATGICATWRIVSRASDDTQSSQEGEPKLWRDMTNEEKGALLLAKHEGRVIQSSRNGTGWALDGRVGYCNDVYFRVKPEPVRETVEMQWSYEKGGKEGFAHPVNYGATHRITFKTVDGNPDCNSIEMEEL